VWDTKRNKYVDFICGLGSNLLGYGDVEIANAIYTAARDGLTLSLGSPLEVEYAEKLKTIFPWVDHIKLLKTGTEAGMSAIKIARAFTSRELVLSEGYHGYSDDFVSLTPPALGVPKRHWMGELKHCPIDDRVAAVIVEPVITDASDKRKAELQWYREQCTKAGALLIFDEVITGFRFPKFSVSNYFGIEPDLIVLGKAIGGGMPLAVVGGKKAIMNDVEYFVSSTFAGERASLAAGLKVIELLKGKRRIEELWIAGEQFQAKFNKLHPELKIEGYPTRGVFKGDTLVKALFWQEACKAGMLFGPSWFFNFHHIPLIDDVISASKDILTRIKTGAIELEGEMPKVPYAQKQRE
jgi:glutamate-1-semialdehyde aminotransferase